MSTTYRYTLPVEETEWKFDGHTDVAFTWEYDDNREGLLQLYAKGKQQQWDAAERIDWSQDLDPENPSGLPDEVVPIFGSDAWQRLTSAERTRLRRLHELEEQPPLVAQAFLERHAHRTCHRIDTFGRRRKILRHRCDGVARESEEALRIRIIDLQVAQALCRSALGDRLAR